MRSYILQAIFAMAFFCMPNLLKAQPFYFTGHTETDSCGGGVTFNYTVNQIAAGQTYKTYFGDGNNYTASSPWAVKHGYTSAGTYTVKHVLYYNGSAVDSVQFNLTTALCNTVQIRLYNDQNSNCAHDNNETHLGQASYIEIDSAGVKIDTITCYFLGYANLTQGHTYTLRLLPIPNATFTCPSSGTQTISIPAAYNLATVDFAYQCNSSSQYDLAIAGLKGCYRPVSYSYVRFSGIDLFTCGMQGANVTASFSPKYNYVSSYPPATSVSGNTVIWNNASINSLFTIQLSSNTTLTLGDTLCASASISPTSGDVDLTNNVVSRCDTVKSSFDPNSKEVSPAGAIAAGTELTYTINFENLGNDTAFNIHILDTLSDMLDVNSFRLLYASHRVAPMQLKGPNNINILKFDLADIKLADSTHPEANKGFVTFKIKAKAPLVPGVQIPNRAGIYFDINPVVMTNSTLNWIINPQDIRDITGTKQAEIYPNPNMGSFTITTDSKVYNNAKLMNALGQVVAEQPISGALTNMDTKALSAGIYYLLLSGPGGSMAEKIEKK